MAIRESGPRHARTGPQGYPPPEAYGPIGFAPELNAGSPWSAGGHGPAHPPGVFVPQQTGRTAPPSHPFPGPTYPAPTYPGRPVAGRPFPTPAHPMYPGAVPPAGYGAAPTNPLATSGFVVALVGAVLALLPVLGLLAWVLCPTGLGLAVAGLAQSGRRAGAGRGLAIAGVVLGALGLVVSLIWLIALAS